MMPKVSLEQWAAFKAVVDEGSFARAAELLNKSQSTVSYTLAKMEQRLPAPVFDQSGRKAELTAFGRALYRHASVLLQQAEELERAAAYLAGGWEAEVVMAVDAIAAMDRVFCALHSFSEQSPQTRIRVLETTLSGTDEALLRGEADLAISARVPPGFLTEDFGGVSKIPVVAPGHPLAQLEEAVSEQQLAGFRQIVIRDSGTRREQNAGWLRAEKRWTVSHFATSIAAVKAGLGFAFIPREKISGELREGSLVPVRLGFGGEQRIPLYIVSSPARVGPATRAVIAHLIKHR